MAWRSKASASAGPRGEDQDFPSDKCLRPHMIALDTILGNNMIGQVFGTSTTGEQSYNKGMILILSSQLFKGEIT